GEGAHVALHVASGRGTIGGASSPLTESTRVVGSPATHLGATPNSFRALKFRASAKAISLRSLSVA
ncbi:hypothetical protein RUM43_008993, partial [Polyplax serrata]